MGTNRSAKIRRARRPVVESLERRNLPSSFIYGANSASDIVGPPQPYPMVSNLAGSVTVTIPRPDRSNTNDTQVVEVSTSDGTAKAGVDYTAIDQMLAFAPGVTDQTVVIPILNSGKVGGQETFNVNLTAVPGLVPPKSWTLTIDNWADVNPLYVQDVNPVVKGHKIVQVQLSFNNPMNSQTVDDVSNYYIELFTYPSYIGWHPKFFRSATYDPATRTVTLIPKTPLEEGLVYRLVFDLTDAYGNPLSSGSGAIKLGEGRELKYLSFVDLAKGIDRNAKLRLSGPGKLLLKTGVGWDPSQQHLLGNLYVLGSNPKRSVLTGTLDATYAWTVVSPSGVKDKARTKHL